MVWFGRVMAVFVVGLFVALFYAAFQHHRRRIAEIQALASQLKFQYFPKGDASVEPLLSNLAFFQQGRRRKITHLIKGQIQRKGQSVTVAIFDYQYMIGLPSNDDSSCFCLTALVFYDESLNLPGFELRREHLVDKAANVMGLQDINFADFPTFSKRYRLLGGMPDRIRAIFQPNIIKFYEREKLCAEAYGSCVLIFPSDTLPNVSQSTHLENGRTHSGSRTLSATEISAHLNKGLSLLNMLAQNQTQT
jgi:hypothetical protein